MLNNKSEKRIYEFLGIPFFKKQILFRWEKIWKSFHKEDLLQYRMDSLNTKDIENYINELKGFAIAHIIALGIGTILINILEPQAIFYHAVNIILNSYCIMVQRYNYLRIEETLIKKRKLKRIHIINEISKNYSSFQTNNPNFSYKYSPNQLETITTPLNNQHHNLVKKKNYSKGR